MTASKINSIYPSRYNPPADSERIEKLSSRLSKDFLESSSQKKNGCSSCHWLVNGIKRFFEKFLSILYCIFCWKYSDKKKESTTDQTQQKTTPKLASTTAAKQDLQTNDKMKEKPTLLQKATTEQETTAKKEIIPAKSELPSSQVNFPDFDEIMIKDLKGLIKEYLEGQDAWNFAISCKDLREKIFNDLIEELGKKEVLSTDELAQLIEKLKDLSEASSGERCSNVGCEIVFKYCKNLKEIHFKGPVNEELLKNIAIHLPVLTIANFEQTDLTDAKLEIFAKNCPQLYAIHLYGCRNITDLGLKTLALHCKQLMSINLSWCQEITDAGLRVLVENCNLQTINLAQCVLITIAGYQALAKNCLQLQELSLSHTKVTEEGLKAIVANCKQLLKLDLSDVKLSDKGFQEIIKKCQQLQELVLAFSLQITDEGWFRIAENCKQLRKLTIAYRTRISIAGLQRITTHCKQLQEINLSNNDITDEGLDVIAANCKQLKFLDLHSCDEITVAGVKRLIAHLPKLQIRHGFNNKISRNVWESLLGK